jgi:hypothetical protein
MQLLMPGASLVGEGLLDIDGLEGDGPLRALD